MRDELRELVARHSVEGSVELPVPRLTLHRSARLTEPVQVLHRPALCVVLQGGKRAILGTRVFTYDPESYLVLSVELPLTSAVVEADRKRPYLGMSLALERSILSPLILEAGGDEPVRPLSAGLTQSPLGPDLLDPLLRLVRLMDSPEDVDFLAPLIERRSSSGCYADLRHRCCGRSRRLVVGRLASSAPQRGSRNIMPSRSASRRWPSWRT